AGGGGRERGRVGRAGWACAGRGRGRVQATEQAAQRATARGRAMRPPGLRFSARSTQSSLPSARPRRTSSSALLLVGQERLSSLGRRGASGAARNPLDVSAGWIARGRIIT